MYFIYLFSFIINLLTCVSIHKTWKYSDNLTAPLLYQLYQRGQHCSYCNAHVTQLLEIHINPLQLTFARSMTKFSSKVQFKHVHKALFIEVHQRTSKSAGKHTVHPPTTFPVSKPKRKTCIADIL